MTVLISAIALAFAPAAADAPPVSPVIVDAPATDSALDPTKVALARDIVAVVLPPDQRDKMMSAVLNAMTNNILAGTLQGLGIDDKIASEPAVRLIFQAFVERQKKLGMDDIHAALPGLVEAYARAYARMFSIDDLREIRTFVQTPAGTRFMQRAAGMLSDPDVAEWQRKLAAQGAARQAGELQRLKADLEAAGLKLPSRT